MVAAGKESDADIGERVFGETDEEEEDNAEAAPGRHHEEADTSAGAAGIEEE